MKLLVIDVQKAIYTPELYHFHVFTETLMMLLDVSCQVKTH